MNERSVTVWTAAASTWQGQARDHTSTCARWSVEEGPLALDAGGADWRGRRALQLEVGCARRTGARIDLQVLDASDEVIGAVTFVADWIGDNDMQLWLHAFQPVGEDDRWAEVRTVRMVCRDPGLWPTVLDVGRIRVVDRIAGWAVNESDTVIDMAWREVTADIEAWRVVDEGTSLPPGSPLTRHWDQCGYVFSFRQGEQPSRLAVERHFDLDVSSSREILAKLTWDSEAKLTVIAIVDGGREIPLLDDERPIGKGYYTSGADLDGVRRLEAVRLEIAETEDRSVDDREIGMGLFWILLRRPTVLDEAPIVPVIVRLAGTFDPYPTQVSTAVRQIQQIPSQEPSWPPLAAGDPATDGLPFGFYISRESLPDLRRAIRRSPARETLAELLAEADRAIATELVDRNYYGSEFGGGIGLPKGLRGAGMRVFAPTVAAAHLLTGDSRYADAGRRWLLRTARSDDWRGDHGGCVDRPHVGEVLAYWDGFTGWYPQGFSGHLNHHFWVADVAFGTVVAYEMLYHVFTQAERDEIETAFADHGVYVLYDRLRYERERYLNTNQGVLIAVPLLMQAAFLRRRDPVFEDIYQWTLDFLVEYGRRPWNEEGVCTEGPAYGTGTLEHYVEALFPLAACLRKTVQEVVAPEALAVSLYTQHCRSTWSDGRPQFVGLGDLSYGHWLHERTLAFFAAYGKDPVARYFWDESYADRPLGSIESLLALADLDLAAPAAEPDLPPAKVYRQQPMAFLRTGWRLGDTLLVMTNLRHYAGHEHLDRGSLIFEYNGEPLLVDPGMGFYGSADAAQVRSTCSHSTLTFSQRDQLGDRARHETSIDAFLSTSGDRCPGNDGGVDWVVVDPTAVYPEAERYRRHLIFFRPDICVLCDEVQTTEPEPVELNFTCLGPLSRSGDGQFQSTTATNRLCIHSQSTDRLDCHTSDFRTSLPDTPAYRLVVSRSHARRQCTFLTALVAHPLVGAAPSIETLALEGGLGVRIRRQDEDVVVLQQERAGRMMSAGGVTTDARIAVLRRASGGVTGAAMLEGTHLAVDAASESLAASTPSLAGGVLVGGVWTQIAGQTYTL